MTSIRDLLRPADNETSTGKRARDADADTDAMDIGATAETTHFTIEFILDIICPYCYIALKNLDAAIEIYTARHPEATFEITCSPFLLDPIAARSGEFYLFHAPRPRGGTSARAFLYSLEVA